MISKFFKTQNVYAGAVVMCFVAAAGCRYHAVVNESAAQQEQQSVADAAESDDDVYYARLTCFYSV